jgi:AraC family transcriptional regulator, regulatory protein of adaptative response / methylated-DNA-[protein]-cysteine methyltransferase
MIPARFSDECRSYRRIQKAIEYIAAHARSQPRLAQVAAHVGLSEFRFQRQFSAWAGISPKRFLQFLTKEYAMQALRGSAGVLEAALSAGLSGPGRLHDLLVTCEAVSPGECRALGQGVEITWGIHPTPFGEALIASTSRGICRLSFIGDEGREAALEDLRADWPQARLTRNQALVAPVVAQAFDRANHTRPLHLWVKGSNFQIKVWEALLRVESGRLVSYREIARSIGMPRAARAVGGAVGANPVAVLIPCHRVIRSAGELGDYRWGLARKRALIAREAAYRPGAVEPALEA